MIRWRCSRLRKSSAASLSLLPTNVLTVRQLVRVRMSDSWASDILCSRREDLSNAFSVTALSTADGWSPGEIAESLEHLLGPTRAPGFQHQNVPDEVLPVPLPREVLLPVTAHERRIDKAGFA